MKAPFKPAPFHRVLIPPVQELPNKYAQRLPYDLLSSLANSLIDGTVFQIVEGLVEIQQMSERNLFNQRLKLINTHRQR